MHSCHTTLRPSTRVTDIHNVRFAVKVISSRFPVIVATVIITTVVATVHAATVATGTAGTASDCLPFALAVLVHAAGQ